jgi:Type IV secretion-system coupling protein DNA-binding domain
MREQISKSRSGGLFAAQKRPVSQRMQPVTKSAVLPSEIEKLPDLQGYLKFASTPSWMRVKMVK